MEKKILVADDERFAANIIRKELIAEGYLVDVAYNGKDAIELYNAKKHDLLILDNRMPEKSGIEVLKYISSLDVQTDVILMTAFGTINDAVYAMKHGAIDYIQKPFDNDELVEKIKGIFGDDSGIEKVSEKYHVEEGRTLIGNSRVFLEFYGKLARIKDLPTTTLLIGESGTGKSAVAKELHRSSCRGNKPFIHLNCATLPSNLVESELFGHTKGSFTGASSDKKGKFEQVGEGTLFLDEISTLSVELQAKLLTVLQERQFEKIGGNKVFDFKGRIIAATNTNLAEAVKKGEFREDLFYRLNVITLECPPLRERKEDVEELFYYFLDKFKSLHEIEIMTVDKGLIDVLQVQPWKGNVRELENTVERLVAMNMDGHLSIKDLQNDPFFFGVDTIQHPEKFGQEREESKPREQISDEYEELCYALKINNNHREKTANYLGISRRTLQYKIKKYNLK